MSKLAIPFSFVKSVIKSNRRLHKFLLKIEYSNKYVFNLFSIFRNIDIDVNSIFKFVEIETCPLCNRRCSFCPIGQDNTPKKLMSDQLFNKILIELKELNFKGNISLSSYGEPLLDKRLAGFAKRIKAELGSKISINTNGDFLTIKKFKELVSAGIDTIIISQHDKESSSTIRDLFSKISSIEQKHLIFQVVNEDSSLANRGGSVEVKKLKTLINCRMQDIFIRADGNVRFCCNDYYCEVKLGNVNQSKLIDIWNSPFYRKIRNEIKKGIFNLEICKRCRHIIPPKQK